MAEAVRSSSFCVSSDNSNSSNALLKVKPGGKLGVGGKSSFQVLFCSEHPFYSENLKSVLQQAASPRGVAITICYSFNEGATLLKKTDFDIILVDADSAGAHGFMHRLSEETNWLNVAVVAVTGSYTRENLYSIFSSGARYCVSKQHPNLDILRRIFVGD